MKNKKVIIIATAVALVLLLALVAIFALPDNGLIAKNVFVVDTDVSGKTVEDATEEITKAYMEANPVIEVVCKENTAKVNFADVGQIDFDATVKNAYAVGRGNAFSRAFSKIFSGKKVIPLSLVINEKALQSKITEAFSGLGSVYTEESFKIDGDKLVLTAGRSGEVIEFEKLDKVIETLGLNQNATLETKTSKKEYKGVDVDALYEKVFREPKDAYYDKEGGKLVPHVVGYSFDKEEAKKAVEGIGEGETVEIQLEVKMPKVLDDDLTGKMFKDVLASYSTNYNPGEVDRTYNMLLAARKVNGTVLEPGAIFSYNNVVGERTVAAGYRNAKIFENGRVVDGLAGGICQVSTTIYNAALYSNMGIVERKNHSFPVAYAPKGQDATVVMGVIDFRFKNTTSRPIKITASVSGGVCRVEILGTKEQNFRVEILNNVVGQTPRPVEYEEDPTLEKGTEIVTQTGSDGYTVTTTRKVYVNGELVKTEKMPSSYYTPLKKIIKRNTAEEPVEEPAEGTEVPGEGEENPSQEPTEDPSTVPGEEVPSEQPPEQQPEQQPTETPDPQPAEPAPQQPATPADPSSGTEVVPENPGAPVE